MPGQILGNRYEVEQQLGKKLGRWTLLARDMVTQDPVIVKVLCIDDEMLTDDLKLFKREVETLQTLSHPATPKYRGYFEIDLPKSGKALALIESYLGGCSLQAHLQQGRIFNELEAQQIAQTVLDALIYLHNHYPPIVHRDIKPSNILLTGTAAQLTVDQIYLIDFGSVRLSKPNELTTIALVGTDGYMPPEQIGRRAVCASDLYSLGVTLLAALTGKPLNHLPQRGSQITAELISCSLAFTQWLQLMTEPELEQRFGSAQTALTALRAIAYSNC